MRKYCLGLLKQFLFYVSVLQIADIKSVIKMIVTFLNRNNKSGTLQERRVICFSHNSGFQIEITYF